MSTGDRYLIVFALAALVMLGAGTLVRRAARATTGRADGGRTDGGRDDESTGPSWRGLRRRSGALLALGPVVGILVVPSSDGGLLALVLGAVALAAFGSVVERRADAQRLTLAAVTVAAVTAVAADARFGPTGVELFDVVLAVAFVIGVTVAVDGFGNADGLVSGMGLAAALSLFAIAGFSGLDSTAAVAIGLAGSCLGFLAFNQRPASLFIGRGGRLAVGFALGVLALAHEPPHGHRWLGVVVPLVALGPFVVDALVFVIDRARRRQPLIGSRADHLVHRLSSLGWSRSEATGLLIIAQAVLGLDALFLARGVLDTWIAAGIAAAVGVTLIVEACRAKLDHHPAPGFGPKVWAAVLVVLALLVAGIAPIAIVARDARALMERGRDAATRGLSSARNGDTIAAQLAFRQAANAFEEADDKLQGGLTKGAGAIPGLAPNARAARTLASVGTRLARAGGDIATSVDPDALEVVNGRLPLEEVDQVTPALQRGARALRGALTDVRRIGAQPYLADPIREVLRTLRHELVRAEREAGNAAAAALVAPSIFGSDSARTYLLVVQNPAENRGTGGLIGNFGLVRIVGGRVSVDPILETSAWNNALRGAPTAYEAPKEYHERYDVFTPQFALQTVNYSPDFPTVARVLLDRAPLAGLGDVDGVLAVDPWGLAALLELSGPIRVLGWPTEIAADNVVDVVLRQQYVAFAGGGRADFVGAIAQAAVARATSGALGKPARLAQVLGRAAHEGHLLLAFADAGEQRTADRLRVSGRVDPVRSDALLITGINQAGNKVDTYLQRTLDYRVRLAPDDQRDAAAATAQLAVTLANSAPSTGLPQIVIGPFEDRPFAAGQNRQYVTFYTALGLQTITSDGGDVGVFQGTELDRFATSFGVNVLSQASVRVDAEFAGTVPLRDGWYELVLGHQTTVNPDRVRVSVEVPEGWRIAEAKGLRLTDDRRAAVAFRPRQSTTLSVRIERDPPSWNLWERLESGR